MLPVADKVPVVTVLAVMLLATMLPLTLPK